MSCIHDVQSLFQFIIPSLPISIQQRLVIGVVGDDDADFCISRGQCFLDVVEFFLTFVLSPLGVGDGGGRGGETMVEVVVGGYQFGVERGGGGG